MVVVGANQVYNRSRRSAVQARIDRYKSVGVFGRSTKHAGRTEQSTGPVPHPGASGQSVSVLAVENGRRHQLRQKGTLLVFRIETSIYIFEISIVGRRF